MTGIIPGRESAERVLQAIPGMAGAALLNALSDGPTNASFLAQCDGEQYVFRLDKPEAARLGLNRLNEHRVSRIVFASGLAPEPIYSDPAAGVYLRRFRAGRSWTTTDLTRPGNLERLARLLRQLHGLTAHGDAFDPVAAARRYAAQLGTEESRALLSQAESLAEKINSASPGPVLCHNDLVCQNILDGEPLMLIDWEYAGLGHRFFDLAVVVQHHSLAPALTSGFLESYLERPATTGDERTQLELQCQILCVPAAALGSQGFVGAAHGRDSTPNPVRDRVPVAGTHALNGIPGALIRLRRNRSPCIACARDIHVRSSAVPYSRRSRQQVPGPSPHCDTGV